MVLSLLCSLLVLDCALVGYRASMGRNPRVRRGPWHRRFILRGALVGVGLVGLVLGVVVALDLPVEAPGRAMLPWFGGYAAAVNLAMLLWFTRSLDVRVLASVLVLGPFTLLRPFVILAGLYAGWREVGTATAGALALGLGLVALGLEGWMRPPYALPRRGAEAGLGAPPVALPPGGSQGSTP